MATKGQHVVPRKEGWAVKTAGASKASKVYTTEKAAIVAATAKAKKDKSELYIHGRDGRIRERNSYGNDPKRRKG